jgi:hypothetical protein
MTKQAKSEEEALTGGRVVRLYCHIRGIVPCIMANGAMADPTYFWAKEARRIRDSVKRGSVMTEEVANLYYHALFMGQLYLADGEKTPHWPAENVEGMIRRGAMRSKKGPLAKICITVCGETPDEIFPLIYDGPCSGEELWSDGRFTFKSRIGGKNGTTINCRPRFPQWEFKFSLLLDREVADIAQLGTWLTDAGRFIGLSAWTPKWGRFEVVSVRK